MRDICTTVNAPATMGGIRYNLFVYEMELHKLPQPFFYSQYYLYLFVCGEGEVRMSGKTYAVAPGTLLLVHPWQLFSIVETKHELTYLYISFSGDGVAALLPEIGAENPITVYPGQEHLLDFLDAIHSPHSRKKRTFYHGIGFCAHAFVSLRRTARAG